MPTEERPVLTDPESLTALAEQYHVRVRELIGQAWAANRATITALAPVIGASIARGDVLHTFGSGHSDLIAREIIGRAGGLVCVTGIIDRTDGFIENLPGYGTRLAELYDRERGMRPGEVLIVVSNSGLNSAPVEIALYAKQRGLRIVALTSLEMSRSGTSQHPDGHRLFEVADFVLDNGGVRGDAIVDSGDGVRAGPTSGLTGCSIMNWVVLGAVQWLRQQGHPVPLLRSQSLPGAIEHNRKLSAKYMTRLSRQLA